MARSAVTLPNLKKFGGIEGIPELKAQISQIIDRTTAEALKDIFYEAGMVLHRRLASAIARHSPSKGNKAFPAGTLRRGLFISGGKPGKANVLVGISWRGRANYLAIWLEYGTHRQPPRPFFRPAVLACKPEMARIIVSGFKVVLDKIAA